MHSRRHPVALSGLLVFAGLILALTPLRARAQDDSTLPPTQATDPSIAASSPVSATASMTETPTALVAATSPAQYIAYDPTFREVDCPFVVPWTEEVSCGVLGVPENRLQPGSATIEIFVTILTSQGRPEGDPVVLIPGGPGEASSPNRRIFYGLPFREHRDVILMDPRGTGLSTPSLACPELDEVRPNSDAAVNGYRTCYERLIAEGRDLTGYNSDEMVEDVADLARVLGVGALNLHGAGYGARIAVLLADRYPLLVRSMVLDGPVPTVATMMLEEPLNLYGVIRRIAADCALISECNAAYPALEARLIEVIDRYNRTPAPPETGYGSGTDIFRLIVDTLAYGGRTLPALITALFEGDFAAACRALPPPGGCVTAVAPHPIAGETADSSTPNPGIGAAEAPWRSLFADPDAPAGLDAELVTTLMQSLGYDTPEDLFVYLQTLNREEVDQLRADFPVDAIDLFSEGVYASVLCSEEAPFYTASDVGRIAVRIPRQFGSVPIERAAALDGICSFWKTPPVSPADKVLQLNTTPTLVIGGTHDPVAPPRWARRAASSLDASTVVLFPGYGHHLLASGDSCVQEIVQDFFEEPNVFPARDCADEMEASFLLPRR